MEGRYIESYLEAEKENAPVVEDGDFDLIGAPLDFLGLNIYYGKYVRSAPETEKGYAIFDRYRDDASVLFQPSSMYWGCRIVNELWPQKEIIISENGISGADYPEKGGTVYDIQRVKYLRGYLSEMARVIREGVPVKGYLHWSLLDNLEWSSGFRPRFGLIFVNYATSERFPKLSYKWYAELIRTGKIV
jgi:beta-glucosidase